MSIHQKSSSAIKKEEDEEKILEGEAAEGRMAEIIPWPDLENIILPELPKRKRVRLEGKYLYHKGKKIPILQFQKSGYDKLLKLLVKEIG